MTLPKGSAAETTSKTVLEEGCIMPRPKRIPGYLHHKPSGQGRVRLDGKDHWLGKYDSHESRRKYDRLIAEWLSRQDQPPAGDLTVSQLCVAFWRHAKDRYGKSGKGRYGAAVNWRPILRLLRQRYGRRPAAELRPKMIKALLPAMVELGWSRPYVNKQLQRLKQMLKWAVSEELIPVEVYQRIATVEGLRKGVTAAREAPPVEPVADKAVNQTLPWLPEVVRDMVRLQRLTGCRPAEVCIIRPCDVDRSRDVWLYVPERHKTEHHGKQRVIFIGPRAQEILKPYLLRRDTSYCFEPRWKRSGKRYTTDSYRRAIHRACERRHAHLAAMWSRRYPDRDYPRKPTKWSPNQLRHAAGTAVRAQYDLEHAQAVLGHSNLSTTQIYAEKAMQKALEVARKLG